MGGVVNLELEDVLLGRRIRILICDTDRIRGQLVAGALKRSRTLFDAIELAETSDEATACAERCEPHVALVSAELNSESQAGFQVLQQLRDSHPDTKPVMLLPCGERDAVVQSFRNGARGVVYRTDSFKTLVKCIRLVHQGQIWASTQDIEFLLQELSRSAAPRINQSDGLTLLTQRELEVTGLVAEGMKNRDIAHALQVTEHTVCNYLYRIFDKLGVSSRAELILYALSRESAVPPAGTDHGIHEVPKESNHAITEWPEEAS